jgi:predicted ATPase
MLALYRSGRQSEALRAFQDTRHTLIEELGIEPGEELRRLEDRILLQDASLQLGTAGPRHNLPLPAAEFVGREQAIADITTLIADERIVTVFGPPGVGKTRLAIEAAWHLIDRFQHGCWLADLAPLTDPDHVAPALAAVLGVPDQEGRSIVDRIARHLRDRRLLVILDNCEHILDGVADVLAQLAPRAPGLHVLATSREVLRVSGEYTYRLDPMAVPDLDADPGRATAFEAVVLFGHRAVAAHPGFSLDSDAVPPVIRICSRLDGIPLAIELAAAKVRSLPLSEIAAGLDDRFRLLAEGERGAPRHHRTLREAVAWSYHLATPTEQRLFRELSVFSGGFTGEDAAAVVADDTIDAGAVIDALASLVDKSLVAVDTRAGGDIRYRLLDTLRQYGKEALEAAGDGDHLGRRHAAHFAAVAESADARLDGPDQVKWVQRLAAEQDNLRAAMRWSLTGSPEIGLRIATSLGRFWGRRGDWSEGRAWMGRLLTERADVPADLAGRAHHVTGMLALQQTDLDVATQHLTEALGLLRRSGNLDRTGEVLNNLAGLAIDNGDLGRARRLLEEALDTKKRAGSAGLGMLINLGWLALEVDDRADGRAKFEAARRTATAEGDADSLAWCSLGLGVLAWLDEDLDAASAHFDDSVERWEVVESKPSLVYGYVGQALARRAGGDVAGSAARAADAVECALDLGGGERYAFSLGMVVSVLAAAGRWTETARLGAALYAIAEEHGWPIWSWFRGHLDTAIEQARSELGNERYAAAREGGRGMTIGDALRFAAGEAEELRT